MKYFIYQGNDHDCGFASLKMYLAYLSKNESYLYIPKPKKRENYSLDDLTEIANNYGIELEAYACNEEYYDEIDSPVLTLIDQNHVVFVKKVRKHSVVLYNPSKGKEVISKDEFLRRWRKVILETNNPETIKKIKETKSEILPFRLRVLSSVCAVISSAILITSFYLLNKQENFIYSLIVLALFILSQILENFILYKQVYNFDTKFIPLYFKNKDKNTKENYVNFVEFKRKYFTSNRKLLTSVLVAFLITFLLAINDFKNVLVLIVFVLIKMLEIMLFSKHENRTKNKIAELESQCFEGDRSKALEALEANYIADSSIFTNSLKDIFYLFLAFAFSIIMMFATGNSGCNFVIFHFLLYYSAFNSFTQIIYGLSNRKEDEIMKCRFLDSCNL